MKDQNILIFLGRNYNSPIFFIEQKLSKYLTSYYKKVICYEYPSFSNLIDILQKKIPLIETKSEKLIIYHSFGILPLGRTFIIINLINHLINYLIIKIMLNKYLFNLIIITFTPEFSFVIFFQKYRSIIYHVIDDYKSMPWWNNCFQQIQLSFLEKYLINKVTKIIVVSNYLYHRYAMFNKSIKLFPTPSNTKIFLQYKYNPNKMPNDLSQISKPIIGFIGTIRDYNIDIDLLSKVIHRYKNLSFILLGILDNSSKKIKRILTENSNCFYLGCKPLNLLPSYLAFFDACIIPYRTNSYGQFAYPVKIMEYLAMSKPIITTALPSIKFLADKGLIYWAKDNNKFSNQILLAMKELKNSNLNKKRRLEAKKNDWSVRIKEYLEIINSK